MVLLNPVEQIHKHLKVRSICRKAKTTQIKYKNINLHGNGMEENL